MLIDVIVELIVFGIVVALVFAMAQAVAEYFTVRRRLGAATTATGPASALLKETRQDNVVLDWVEGATLNDSKERTKLRADLNAAGFEGPSAPVIFVIARFLLAIGLPLGFMALQAISPKPWTGFGMILAVLMLSAIGFIGPRAFIDNRANGRRTQLEYEFPDALDLMVVCIEAGLGIEAAFVRVGSETVRSHPLISDEINRCSQEFRAGRSRADALRAMASRTMVDAVRSFVALLIQTDALGTSIGQTLKTYADEMREHRFLRAEEKAMRIPVLLTVPLVACILPVIIVSLLLPPAIDVMRTLLPALTGRH
jgi:tight adherence protein C